MSDEIPTDVDDAEEMLTVAEVATKLRVSKETVYGLCEDEEIGHHRIGRKIVIPEAEFKAYKQHTFVPARNGNVVRLRHLESA